MSPAGDFRLGFARRVALARWGAVAAFGGMAVAYWYLQIVRGTYYRQLSESNRIRSVPIPSPRGFILDRRGTLLAENEPAYSLLLYRRETRDLGAAVRSASRLVQLPPDDAARRIARYRSYYDYVPIDLADNLTLSEVARVEAHLPENPEFAVGIGQRRRYPLDGVASHLLGYLSEATSAQVAADPARFRPGVSIGQRGVEKEYQDLLAGRDGERRVVVDSFGHEVAEERRTEPVPGQNLTLTIDARLQRVAETYLAGRAGAAVAMDPRTGEILALASAPAFDPNVFSGRLSSTQWKDILDSPGHPLQDRAIQNVFSPGSVFKIFLAEAALAEGIITPETKVFCPGYATFYGRTFRCHKRDGHGWVDLDDAIRESCDVYFYTLGRRLGIRKIGQIAESFGFGQPTGVDLPGEKAGLVPSPEWSLARRHARWYPSETISVAIGQGPLLVSAMQLARAVSGLVEGGAFPRPHVFLAAEDPRTGRRLVYRDSAERRLTISPEIVDRIEDAMWGVVNEPGGTAYLSRIPGVDFCGKTGSVQVVAQADTRRESTLSYEKKDHAWFVGFAPKRDPHIVVAVFVEHGEHGASAAAPLARDLVRAYLGLPVPEEQPPAPPSAPSLVAQVIP